ncbi:HPr family phosphocarrier protein [uncultured Oscillibacter sp.]|uniref:HPr family phosphocarrier protein n=1 Tax=uncultured Oscillibacter sp. TaxID=876091 RepID=UPI0028057891|nr:HPr family phosphocarrier protein [uncultured Oscillibacter sp.]
MISTKEVTVRLSAGLHHQAATRFIQTANRYSSTLRVLYGGNSVNAKSLLGVVSLSIGAGAQITLTADGPDAGDALQALEQCLIAAD